MSDVKSALESIVSTLDGATVPRPSGQLAGHAGGLPFENLVHRHLISRFPGQAFRHFEALNHCLLADFANGGNYATTPSYSFGPAPLNFLVARSRSALNAWKPTNLFEEKQNDTAESIVFSDSDTRFYSPLVSLVDVKSQRVDRNPQPPNIISAQKVAKTAVLALEGGREPTFEIIYVGVRYKPDEENGVKVLRATEWTVVDLMALEPSILYINWAAARQIQFHPFEVKENYTGTRLDWCRQFIEKYANSLDARVQKQVREINHYRKLIS